MPLAELIIFCRVNLGEAEAERLVGWIAWRTGRAAALAGTGEPLERLEHALTHWLDDEHRRVLLSWLERRREAGSPMVPGQSARRIDGPPPG